MDFTISFELPKCPTSYWFPFILGTECACAIVQPRSFSERRQYSGVSASDMNQQRNGGHAPPAFTFIDTAMPDKSREGGEGALCTSDDYLAYIDEYISDGLKALNRQTDATDVNDATESGSTNDAPVVSTASADHARPSTSPAAIEKVSFTTKDTASLPDCALHYQWYMEQTPITDGTYNVEGVTENWSASYQHLGFIGKIDHARPSTTRARMEEASASFQDGVTIPESMWVHQVNPKCQPAEDTSTIHAPLISGHTEKTKTGSTSFTLPVYSSGGDYAVASTSQTGTEEACVTSRNDARDATAKGGMEQQKSCGVMAWNQLSVKSKHKCGICDKFISRADHLPAHYRTHTGMPLQPEEGNIKSCVVSVAMFRAQGTPYRGTPRNTRVTRPTFVKHVISHL
ncbi:uncharacterized protein [Dermacentor albipictus]|uniref:uncharacterized protein isoform X4 n=1 Tax=Dermacentor albipictus TaxID=60249 RepID=UPI0038FC0A7B